MKLVSLQTRRTVYFLASPALGLLLVSPGPVRSMGLPFPGPAVGGQLTAPVIPQMAFLGSSTLSAQVANADIAAVPDTLCDYCKDFTDAAMSVGSVRSAYRPGMGYATDVQAEAELPAPSDKQEAGQK